jgi:hypothetical protein
VGRRQSYQAGYRRVRSCAPALSEAGAPSSCARTMSVRGYAPKVDLRFHITASP